LTYDGYYYEHLFSFKSLKNDKVPLELRKKRQKF
jgi:hypothetical protein